MLFNQTPHHMKTLSQELTYWEFINYVKNTPHNEGVKKNEHWARSVNKSRNRTEWTGTKSFTEALELAINGWDAGLEQLPLEEGVLTGSGTEFNENVHGALVNVPNFIQGLPTSMWEMSEKREYNLPELTVYMKVTASANHDLNSLMKRCGEAVEYINKMQQTHHVKIIVLFDTILRSYKDNRTYRQILEVVVKDFNERFVLNNIAFAFHTSFFRRLWFKYAECQEHFEPRGYGSPSGKSESEDYIQKNAKGKAVILPSAQDHQIWKEEYIIHVN